MDTEGKREFEDFMGRVSGDPELRGKMRADPSGVLEEQGIGIPRGAEIRVVEDSAAVRHFVLPPDPNAILSDDRLAGFAGGSGSPDLVRGTDVVPMGSTTSPFANYFSPIS